MKKTMIADTKTFRAKHGLTQAQLAELLPVNLRTLQEWESEREKGQPMPFLWRALAHLEAGLARGEAVSEGVKSMNQQTVIWLASLEKIHTELINSILPLSSRHSLEAPDLVQAAETLDREIEQYFKRFDVQIVPQRERNDS